MSKLTLFVILALVLLITSATMKIGLVAAAPQVQDAHPVELYFFWGEGCPHCAQQKPFLEALSDDYPNLTVHAFEVYNVEDNLFLFMEMALALGFEARGVPTTIVGDRYWTGYSDSIAQDIRAHVQACTSTACPDAGSAWATESTQPEPVPTAVPEEESAEGKPLLISPSPESLTIPLLGTLTLGNHSLAVSTALIAFVDGFNPCSLWVLSILLSLILRTGSRKKVFVIGSAFLAVTALIYALLIAGLFTVFAFISFVGWIQVLVALIALFFAAVNIKDYFFYKQGISMTISDEKKPGLYRGMRKIMNAESLGAMVVATVVMAAGVSLVEFPCTAGFPVLWTNLLAGQGVGGITFGLLLALYMLVYLLDEIAIFLVAVVTLTSNKLQEKHGRILKLFGGTLMLTLAMVMLIDPTLLSSVSSTLVVFAAALFASLILLIVHRIILPLAGIYVGTELEPRGKLE